MKRVTYFLHSLLFITLFVLASCGKDAVSVSAGSSESLIGKECSCAATYSPVCDNKNIRYENMCIAQCYGVKPANTVPGNCICDHTVRVCAVSKIDYTTKPMSECEAINDSEFGRSSIIKYSSKCN